MQRVKRDKRLSALEFQSHLSDQLKGWVTLFRDSEQPEEEVLDAYEKEHGERPTKYVMVVFFAPNPEAA